jgi:NAD(P)-dependent dehydrogenase (short-subunit alcohol dehydrogenase family)
MTGKLQHRVALVTGGAVRLGSAICRALAHEGATVVIHYRRSRTEAEALEKELGRAFVVQADLTSESACARLIDHALKMAGGLDFLVNSAAVFGKDALRASSMDKVMAEFWPNFFAPMQLIRSFAARQKTGRIVNILDRRVAGNETGCVPYLLSKRALADLTRLAALELAPHIVVNGVAPGPILPPPGHGEDYMKDHAGRIPLDARPTPEDIADAVLYLLKSRGVTGQVLYVDGGQHLLGTGAVG